MAEGAVHNAGLCLVYIVLNAALNFLNRWALGVHGFRFPLALTAAHMLFNPVLLWPVMMAKGVSWEKHVAIIKQQWAVLGLVGVLNGAQIALNNSSLVLMELSLNQVVRAAMPVFVALLARVVEQKVPTTLQLGALASISLGVMLAVCQPGLNLQGGSTGGTLLVLCSVSIMAAQMSFSGKLGLKLDAIQMTFYTGWVSFASIAGFVLAFEGSDFANYVTTHPAASVGILGGSCCMAVVYNVVVFETIRGLSSVGSAVLGNVKVVVILLVSSVWMGEMRQWLPRQQLGCFLTFAGAAWYSELKRRASSPAKKQT